MKSHYNGSQGDTAPATGDSHSMMIHIVRLVREWTALGL